MNIMKIIVKGLKLFENEKLEINLVAQNRVTSSNGESLERIFNNVFLNKIIAFVGKNASGKTTELSIYKFVHEIFIRGNSSINQLNSLDYLIGDSFEFENYFFDEENKCIYKVVSEIKKYKDESQKDRLKFGEEVIYRKNIKSTLNRTNLFNIDNFVEIENGRRSDRPKESANLLPYDYSYFRTVTQNLNYNDVITDLSIFNDRNDMLMPLPNNDFGNLNHSILNYLDPSIEYVKGNNNSEAPSYEIKFKNSEKPIIASQASISNYLSSGTIRGFTFFGFISLVVQTGSTLIVDEIENHFHKEIIKTIIDIFKRNDINKRNAKLVFSTHYPELLDIFDRTDDIYVSIKNDGLISLKRYSDENIRNDLKKSDVYLSNYINGTAPSYKDKNNLIKNILSLDLNSRENNREDK